MKGSAEVESDETPLFQRAANSIVAEYLKRCHFEYTLSTFLPESGTSVDKVKNLDKVFIYATFYLKKFESHLDM